eukprot:7220903-Lingulodinium_polyedra.AAC.1
MRSRSYQGDRESNVMNSMVGPTGSRVTTPHNFCDHPREHPATNPANALANTVVSVYGCARACA